MEIIIVDDGSSDATGKIADDYQMQYPNIVTVVHKENGGHGSGVNKGLELASGIYFKVVDSDDWLEEKAYQELLSKIKSCCDSKSKEQLSTLPDLFVTNYVYDHLGEGTSHEINYRNVFPTGQVCNWNEIRRFHLSQYLIMHALTFQTGVLRKAGVKLPEHTFYVDNIFAYQPLPYVKNICYLDVDFYHYYIGREDQSVNEKVLMSRIDQQIRVTEIIAKCADLEAIKGECPKLADYMYRNISIMMAISSVHLLLIDSKEAERKRRRLWSGIKNENRPLYYRLRYRTLSGLTCLPGKLGGKITLGGYRIARKIYRFQ